MAYYFIFPEKDATIYSHPDRTKMNTGNDEILEIVKEKGSSDSRYYPSRILIKFNNKEIKSTITDKVGPSIFNNGTSEVCLQLQSSGHKNLTSTLNLELFALSQSFDEGTGRYPNLPITSNGASWAYRDNDVTKTEWVTASFGNGSTGSIDTHGVTEGGGVWYTGSAFKSSQQFLRGENLDTKMDVTTIVQKYSASLFASDIYPTGITNEGFLIKQPDSVEVNTSGSFGEMQYFSVDTHTIYPPRLIFKWDDSFYSPIVPIDSITGTGELNVSLYGNKEKYNQNDEGLFRIHVRNKYPDRTFVSSSNYLNPGYFVSESYYSVRDAHTEEEIIPFDDNFTKLSADKIGMFFKLHMKGLQPERNYRILFKQITSMSTTIYDDNYYFKVVR